MHCARLCLSGVSRNSRCRPFREWKPLIPVPEMWECFFSFPSCSRISGIFFYSLPVSEFWGWLFFIPFPFRTLGVDLFFSAHVLELQKVSPAQPFCLCLYLLNGHARSPQPSDHLLEKSGQVRSCAYYSSAVLWRQWNQNVTESVTRSLNELS